jgi:hypothetical protein
MLSPKACLIVYIIFSPILIPGGHQQRWCESSQDRTNDQNITKTGGPRPQSIVSKAVHESFGGSAKFDKD